MTTIGQCELNVHEDSKKTEENATNGNTNVFNQWRTLVTATSKTVVAEVVRALATQERGIDIGGVASCATVAVGQINVVVVFVQIILAHQGRVGATQASRWINTTRKGSIVIVAS
jgi:anti-sigma-K factor RskA